MHESRRLTRLPDESLREGLVNATQEQIISAVLSESGLSFDQANDKTRSFDIVMTRHMIHYLLSVNADRSFESIRYVFMKDHATVVHSRNVVEDMIDTNHEFKLKIIKIATKIKNSHEEKMSDYR